MRTLIPICHPLVLSHVSVGLTPGRPTDCFMPREGIFVKVLEEGQVKAGDAIQVLHPR
mgnify:CR=1 FL=1